MRYYAKARHYTLCALSYFAKKNADALKYILHTCNLDSAALVFQSINLRHTIFQNYRQPCFGLCLLASTFCAFIIFVFLRASHFLKTTAQFPHGPLRAVMLALRTGYADKRSTEHANDAARCHEGGAPMVQIDATIQAQGRNVRDGTYT